MIKLGYERLNLERGHWQIGTVEKVRSLDAITGREKSLALLWQIEGTGQVLVDSRAMVMVTGDRDVRGWRMA